MPVTNNRKILLDTVRNQIRRLDLDKWLDAGQDESSFDPPFLRDPNLNLTARQRSINVWDRVPNPVSLEDPDCLPSIFFGVGGKVNDDTVVLSESEEIYQLIVNAALTSKYDISLVDMSLEMDEALDTIVNGIRRPDDENFKGTFDRARVVSSEPFTQGLSDIEYIRYTINIYWSYRIFGPNRRS